MVEMHEENQELNKEEEKENPKKSFQKKLAKLEEELAKAKADSEHWKNEYYRAYADTQNLRKSLEKEHQTAIRYRAEGFIEDLLPILDSFHMALDNEPANQEIKNYLVGFQYIYRNLVGVLENEGVQEISPKIGDKFDASTMNAVETVEHEGDENLIASIHTKGYKLHDRLIRPANVAVTKKKTSEQPENKIDA